MGVFYSVGGWEKVEGGGAPPSLEVPSSRGQDPELPSPSARSEQGLVQGAH